MKTILITGSAGLIGYELSRHYLNEGWRVVGIDNDTRGKLFGPQGSGAAKIADLRQNQNYHHHHADIVEGCLGPIFKDNRIDAIVHCAAQPAHEQSGRTPLLDFKINALGTMNVLECARLHCREAPFVHLSSSKVYGDRMNYVPLVELPTRYDFSDPTFAGIDESWSIDQSLHSPYGASKASSDLMAQEYARYYDMPVMVIRPTNMTGPAHGGVEMHGYLNYLVKCALNDMEYRIIGYGGKQVRDNIHACDVVSFIAAMVERPRPGGVWNLGSGKANARSILETIDLIFSITGQKMRTQSVYPPRKGDHCVYYTDLSKALRYYPQWRITKPIETTVQEMIREMSVLA